MKIRDVSVHGKSMLWVINLDDFPGELTDEVLEEIRDWFFDQFEYDIFFFGGAFCFNSMEHAATFKLRWG